MRLKQLESALSSVQREFPNPNITLEQYPTSPHLTAAVILDALQRQDVGPGTSVIDLGCGTAMLAIGCALVDTDYVLGIDCDDTALQHAWMNIREMELDDRISLLQAMVPHVDNDNNNNNDATAGRTTTMRRTTGRGKRGTIKGNRSSSGPPPSKQSTKQQRDNTTSKSEEQGRFPLCDNCVDTVITNPPFGTKPNTAGIDIQFLKLACQLARRSVYSFHKSSTRDYILRTMNALPVVKSITVIAEMKFDLPQSYRFHQKASVDIAVDLIRVELYHHDNNATTASCPPEDRKPKSDELEPETNESDDTNNESFIE